MRPSDNKVSPCCQHVVPGAPIAAGLLGCPGSWRLCAQHSTDSAQCVSAVGTVCGTAGVSQLTQPGKPRESLTPPWGMTGTLPRGSIHCPQGGRLGPARATGAFSASLFSPQLSASRCFLRKGLSEPGVHLKLDYLTRIPDILLPPPLQRCLGIPQALAAASFLHSCWRFELTSSY